MSENQPAVRTVHRIGKVLRCFSSSEPVLTLTDISKRLQLPLSTVHRLVSAMVDEGFLTHSSDGRGYQYAIQLLEWGFLAQYNLNFRDRVKPYLHALKEATNENAALFVRDGVYGVSVEGIESSQSLRVTSRVGDRLPIYASSIVLVLLAFLPQEEIEEIVNEIKFEPFTPTTISNRAELYRQMEIFRQQGYGFSTDWYSNGSVGIAAPVYDYTNKVVASLSLAAPTVRVTDENRASLIERVVTTANELSLHLGYRRS